MNKILWLTYSLGLGILTAGCGLGTKAQASSTPQVREPTIAQYGSWTAHDTLEMAVMNLKPAKGVFAANSSVCIHPAGWREYQVGEKDTPDLLVAWFGTTLEALLKGNCLSDAVSLVPGSLIYVPNVEQSTALQTVLPLGVSAFIADPLVVQPGTKVTLYWQGQGPVRNVRIGWIYNGLFVEQASQLPSSGIIELDIPSDGRDRMTFLVSVSDGGHEVAAQTTVRVMCKETWFFAPIPSGCPSAPLVTNFQEQHFERGTIVYIPALGVHYVMVAGQEAVVVHDDYIPGMPLMDNMVGIPAGYKLPQGALYYVWKEDSIRAALGFAISDAVEYPGMMQRSVSSAGEIIYFSASSGHVYRVGQGIVWGVIIPA